MDLPEEEMDVTILAAELSKSSSTVPEPSASTESAPAATNEVELQEKK
jgi:hypothetical protein